MLQLIIMSNHVWSAEPSHNKEAQHISLTLLQSSDLIPYVPRFFSVSVFRYLAVG